MVDSIAVSVKGTANLEKLVARLTDHCKTDVEKYRSIFTWIAHNVAYDVEAKKNPALRDTDPQAIIKKGKAVCAGYSALFLRLCELANLECVTVNGWARHRNDIGKKFGNTDHAWNAIKVGNDWYLCDVTWAAGSTGESTGTFEFEFKDSYFCTPPALFSYSHFPEDKRWFLGGEVSEKQFINRPHFYPTAVKLNLRDLSADDGTIKFQKGKVLKFQFTVDQQIKIILVRPSTEKNSVLAPFDASNHKIQFEYTLDTYSPFLYIYANGKSILVYRMTK